MGKDNPLTVRKRFLRMRGKSIEWYEQTLTEQGGVCAICLKPETETRSGVVKHYNIDHDHRCCSYGCNKCIRGLLCSSCNRALGKFNDNINSLQRAIDYLKKYDIPESV